MASEEYVQVQQISELRDKIRSLNLPDESSRPLGHGEIKISDLDFDTLIDMRRNHETKQAVSGVRQRQTRNAGSLRSQLVKEFHNALKDAQDEVATGTGLERQTRWRTAAPGGREGVVDGARLPEPAGGNSANAVATAAALSKTVSYLDRFRMLYSLTFSRPLLNGSVFYYRQRFRMFKNSLMRG